MIRKYLSNSNIYLFFAFLIMAVLFYSSSQTYEQQSQVGLLQKVLKAQPSKTFLENIRFFYAGDEISVHAKGYFKFVEFFIRKGAHFGTYFLLGSSWFMGLRKQVKNGMLTAVVAWLGATGYAALDEYHQMLTGGRTPLFQDVVLDSVGALTAVIFFLIITTLLKKHKGRKRKSV